MNYWSHAGDIKRLKSGKISGSPEMDKNLNLEGVEPAEVDN